MFSTEINELKWSDREELGWNESYVLLQNRPIHQREVRIRQI